MIPKINEQLKTVLPRLNKTEYADLEASIKEKGQLHPIVTCQLEGSEDVYILDGHNRFEIATKLSITPVFDEVPYIFKCAEEAMIWIIDNQTDRRSVPTYIRAALKIKKKDLFKKIGKGLMTQGAITTNAKREDPDWLKKPLVGSGKLLPPLVRKTGSSTLMNPKKHDTNKQLAKEAGVSEGTFYKVAEIESKGSEDLKARAWAGEITINAAYNELRGLNSDEPPMTDIDKTIAKIHDLASKIFDCNKTLNDDQRDDIFSVVEILKDCVHAPEEYNPNLPSFGDPEA